MQCFRPALAISLAVLMLAPAGVQGRATKGASARTAAVARGHDFAAAHCTACHAITANGSSPNPESPPFDDIANRDGVSAQTFAAFLADAHNYPAAMDFTVDHAAIRDLAAYMLTLRKPGYRPTR